jgi:catechol 2,3-dioxygenase-like lactoylglutathione lyase family enzyme
MVGQHDAQPTIGVRDLEKATSFYGGVLGLHVSSEKDYEVMYDSGNTQVTVYKTEFAGTNKATYVTWEVDNIEDEVTELKDKGVTFEHYDLPYAKLEGDVHVMGDGKEKAAWFKDPDGNVLCLHQ